MLAFSTVDDMGYLLLGIVAGPGAGLTGALTSALSHALCKVLLFSSVGVAEEGNGRALSLDRGLLAHYPVAGAAFIAGAFGIIGVPPLVGFAGRQRLYPAGAQMGGPTLALAMVAATGLALLYYVRAAHRAWFGPEPAPIAGAPPAASAPWLAGAVLAVLIVLSLALGLFPRVLTSLIPSKTRGSLMDNTILKDIVFTCDEAGLLQQLHIRPGRAEAAEALALAAEARILARPQALYKLAFVEERGRDYIVVDGVRLNSRVLSVNLANVHRVFAFTATGGVEMEAWQHSKTDLLQAYYADMIAELALRSALAALDTHLRSIYGLAPLSMMNPGSLPDWPLPQQQALFSILGDAERAIGVRLTPSYLMIPRKSVSGIKFPAEESFASCQLCPREGCPNRRAPYDQELFDRKYAYGVA